MQRSLVGGLFMFDTWVFSRPRKRIWKSAFSMSRNQPNNKHKSRGRSMVNNRAKISMKKTFLLIAALVSLLFFVPSCSKNPYQPTPDPTEMLGDVMFWTDANYSGGRISVTFRSATMTITRYYYNGTPDCGSQGCATYENVPIGTYSFHAENTRYTWEGEVTIREGICSRKKLIVSKGETSAYDDTFDDAETTDFSFELTE